MSCVTRRNATVARSLFDSGGGQKPNADLAAHLGRSGRVWEPRQPESHQLVVGADQVRYRGSQPPLGPVGVGRGQGEASWCLVGENRQAPEAAGLACCILVLVVFEVRLFLSGIQVLVCADVVI